MRLNGLGQRVSKTAPGSTSVSRRFVYDEAGHLIGEYNGAGAPIQETVYLGDLPIAVLSGTDDIHYVQADQINTPRAITDTQGVLVWRWEPDPFGVGSPDQDPDGDALSFVYNLRMPGQHYDQETGLHYNYFRDYEPTLGRYVQSDPIGLREGINTYAYVSNNPLNLIDPLGLCSCTARPGTKTYPEGADGTRSFYGRRSVRIRCEYSCSGDDRINELVSGTHTVRFWWEDGYELACIGIPYIGVFTPDARTVWEPGAPESFDPRDSESQELQAWGERHCKDC